MEDGPTKLFDLSFWLDSPASFYRANRCGLERYVPLEHLPEAMRKLVDVGVVGRQEALELLEELGVEVPRGTL